MISIKQGDVRNRLLQALDPDAFAYLQPQMKRTELPVRTYTVKSMQTITRVCFLESGLASKVATNPGGASVEVGHVGREGMTGYTVVLHVDKTPVDIFMQVEGHGIFIPADHLMQGIADGVLPQDLFLRYAHVCDVQLAQSVLANAQYTMHQRLARWLLMCHDRIENDDMPLTHEFLAIMLGVRRAGVTGQLHILEGMHAIKSTRGLVRILDRTILEKIAGDSYGTSEREYDRWIGTPFTDAAHADVGGELTGAQLRSGSKG
ncbi:Crp/Fnr family transcriptional regulator [Oryzifoliimicrobium ureilyticus]|uniref:Crp/Fnr family transcriptional regulator n=1 Tax=Oryzifoliimicrobium ureilyticus TaxID=3113724 RepID=UPI00307611AE